MALDVVGEMLEAGLTVSMLPINHILHACEESCNYNLVRCIILFYLLELMFSFWKLENQFLEF